MSLDTLQYFFQRVPCLNYVSPPICEMEFSSSATPTIVLNPHARKLGPTGLEFFVQDGRIFLRWNNYPGAICFSIYKAVDELEPFGDYHLVAECVQSPFDIDSFGPGTYRVTAITLEGESGFSDPVTVTEGAGGAVVTVEATNPNTGFDDVPGVFRISRTGFTIQPVTVFYNLAGTAVNGTNYETIPTSVVIPAGQSFVDIFIVALDLGEVEETDVVLIVVPSVQLDYAVGDPSDAQVIIAEQTGFTCGTTPDSVEDAVWEDKEVAFPFGGDIVNGDGSFSITVTTSSTAASKITNICNPGEAYEIEITADWDTSGTVQFSPTGYPVTLQVIINGIPQDSDARDGVTGPFTDMVVNATLPAESVVQLEIRVGFLAIGAPSATFFGTITVRPLTPP